MRSFILAMVAGLGFWSGSAEATTFGGPFHVDYTVTYKGLVSSGYDQNGRFIAADSNFNNESFKLVFEVTRQEALNTLIHLVISRSMAF